MSPDVTGQADLAVPSRGPVQERNRIVALDAVRGVALLGILFVNLRFFAMPVGLYEQWLPSDDATTLDALAHWFIKIFCESKFYPLYSMLFGMGLVLQRERMLERGRAFTPVYLRRLAVLFLIGAGHALLLWYGDILLVYSVAGLVLLCFAGASARRLVTTGLVLLGLTTVAVTALALISSAPESTGEVAASPEAETAPILTEGTPLARLFEGFEDEDFPIRQVSDPRWMAYETEAYREGPFSQAFGFRAITYIGSLIAMYILGGMGFHVLGMFFLGAGLMKAGIFEPARHALRRRLVLAGLLVGLPLTAGGALLPLVVREPVGEIPLVATQFVGGSLMSLAYLAGVILLVDSRRLRAPARAVSAAGRMGLTSYLAETVLATAVTYWWGLALFGTISPALEVALTLAIYAAVVLFSMLWMRTALFGPMEWVWRWLTYARRPPLFRRRSRS